MRKRHRKKNYLRNHTRFEFKRMMKKALRDDICYYKKKERKRNGKKYRSNLKAFNAYHQGNKQAVNRLCFVWSMVE